MPSPPQGYTVILPGEITQSDLDPQQPPAKLTSWPLTIGKDIPGPNESNYVANDNTGNLLDIVNSDTSSITLSALKMAIDKITLIRTNGELAMNLANSNNWSGNQSFAQGISFSSIPSSGRVLDLTALSGASPYLDEYFNIHFPNASTGGNYIWSVSSNNGKPLQVYVDPTLTVLTAKNTLDDGSGNMTVSGNLSTATLDLDNAGSISALVSSFNGRTGAVVPASGDYSHHTMINSTVSTTYAAESKTQIGTIKTGPNGVVFWFGSCLTETPSSGNIVIYVGSTGPAIGMGPTSTGSNWSINDSELTYYPVVLSGITDSLSPNTLYDIYLSNGSSSSMNVYALNAAIIGL
jgi:hypothetical protein